MNADKKVRMPIFRDRLDEMRGDLSYAEFAEKLGLSRATVGFYLAGERVPNAIDLKRIAQKCEVSADYLIGLSSDKGVTSTSGETAINLSEEAILQIKKISHDSNIADSFDFFLCNEDIWYLLNGIYSLAKAKSDYYYDVLNSKQSPVENKYDYFCDNITRAIENSKLDEVISLKSGMNVVPEWVVLSGQGVVDHCQFALNRLFTGMVNNYVGSEHNYLRMIADSIEEVGD